MKKLVACIIVLAFTLSTCVYAEFTPEQTITSKRGLVEFCELYIYRFMTLQELYDLDYDLHIFGRMSTPFSLGDGLIHLSSTAGAISVNQSDYTVHSIVMTYLDLDASDDKNEQSVMSCLMALSALEYSDREDMFMQMDSKMHGGPSSAIDKVLEMHNDWFSDSIGDAFAEAVRSGERVLVYSGNYDYYVAYNSGEQDGRKYDYIHLIAEARE